MFLAVLTCNSGWGNCLSAAAFGWLCVGASSAEYSMRDALVTKSCLLGTFHGTLLFDTRWHFGGKILLDTSGTLPSNSSYPEAVTRNLPILSYTVEVP